MGLFHKIFIQSLLKFVLLAILAVLLIIFSYLVLNSKIISLMLGILFFALYGVFFKFKAIRQCKAINYFEQLNLIVQSSDDYFEQIDKNSWYKGYSLLKEETLVCWINVDDKGIKCLFFTNFKNKHMFLSWDNVLMLEYCYATIRREDIQLARVVFKEHEVDLFLPWNQSMDMLIPNSVAISK